MRERDGFSAKWLKNPIKNISVHFIYFKFLQKGVQLSLNSLKPGKVAAFSWKK